MYALSYLSADFFVLIFHATMLIVKRRFLLCFKLVVEPGHRSVCPSNDKDMFEEWIL